MFTYIYKYNFYLPKGNLLPLCLSYAKCYLLLRVIIRMSNGVINLREREKEIGEREREEERKREKKREIEREIMVTNSIQQKSKRQFL